MRITIRPIIAVVTAIALASCTPEAPVGPIADITNVTFAASLGVNLSNMTKTASGLYYQDTPAGTGNTAVSGNRLTVHYTGNLINGSTFDSSVGKAPFAFTLGGGNVIKGWDEGLAGMKVGGTRKLVIPPALAYGAIANGAIPASSILVFMVQLISIP